MTYKQHREKWKNCKECDLCERRTKVVLARGTIPCDVLFVGEAPGVSEDVLGRPFVGPAGKLLDKIIKEAMIMARVSLPIAFTNLICCIPKDGDNQKVTEPPKYAVDACADRLYEFEELCDPDLIVLVGKLPSKYYSTTVGTIAIVHPAAILRMDVSQKGLQIQRAVVTLADAFEEL